MGTTYSVETVPAIADYLKPYALPPAGSTLSADDRFQGKIKWYLMPEWCSGVIRNWERT